MINPYETPNSASNNATDPFAGIGFPVIEHVVITPDIVAQAHFAAHGTGSSVVRFAAGIMACILSLLTVGIGWTILNERFSVQGTSVLAIFGFTAALFGVWAISGKTLLRRLLIRHFHRRAQLVGPVVYELTPAQIVVHNDGEGYRAAWSQILAWRQYEGVIIAFYARNRYLILPTFLFGAEANDVVWQMLGE